MTSKIILAIACLAGATPCSVSAQGRTHRMQGLFCNTESQVDQALGYMRKSLSPRIAVELTNNNGVVCTYVDLLRYVVNDAVLLGEIPGNVPLMKYKALLIAVVVGHDIRPVTPPVRVFFVAPERLTGALVERRA